MDFVQLEMYLVLLEDWLSHSETDGIKFNDASVYRHTIFL